MCLKPVSYTHLDVYKRQRLLSEVGIWFRFATLYTMAAIWRLYEGMRTLYDFRDEMCIRDSVIIIYSEHTVSCHLCCRMQHMYIALHIL